MAKPPFDAEQQYRILREKGYQPKNALIEVLDMARRLGVTGSKKQRKQ